jgi:predicted RNA binding protein YcfA (HicA-like mRNA interferase family)
MKLLGSTARQETLTLAVPVLARIWHEDSIWNISAFDLPIVAYGDELEEARTNFEEALIDHFQSLAKLNRLHTVASNLITIAQDRGFYEQRIKPRQVVEKFEFNPSQQYELCATH